jgi:predicted dehydrogenase
MTKLRVGIAGYGVVGQRRRHFIDLHDDMEVLAVCDQTFADEGTLNDGVNYHQTYQQLLEEDLDCIFVCLTNDIAPEVTVESIKRDLHVFCEKPPGRTVEDIRWVMETERQHPDCRLKYGFNHRYHESVVDALKIVRSNEFGRVINLRGVYGKSKFISFGKAHDWRIDRNIAGGGILLDQGIHLVDLMRLFAGEFTEVKSFVSNDFWGHDVEDNAYALMRTKEGCVAMLHSTATQWRHRFNLEITLEKAALILSGILSGSKSYGAETLTVIYPNDDDQGDPRETVSHYTNDPSWANEIKEFSESIQNNKKSISGTSEDALHTMELVYKIYHADPEWSSKWNIK